MENTVKAPITGTEDAKTPINIISFVDKIKQYRRSPLSFILMLLVCLAAVFTIGILFVLVAYILIKGIPNVTPALFEWTYTSDNASMMPALVNTLLITFVTLVISVPIGVFTAIYLVEYAKKGSRFVKLIRVTAETLSGIPSIVYGLFGFILFSITLGLGNSILSGIITLAIMILPLIIRTSEEALLSVSDSYREGSFGLGAGKLRTIFKIVLPSAMPGIASGIILAIGRIVGESAALIYTAGTNPAVPKSLLSSGRTLSVHMYCLMNEGLGTNQAYGAAVVLLLLVLLINGVSEYVTHRLTAKTK